ncbi:MAG: OprO/OprP family phosphate-selective porin [Nitrospira sp.]|nr:OprO/OprP family phosphate-selective porin [Nitrospira sp.]
MIMRSLLGALSILALAVTPAFAEESLEERVKRLEEALQKAQQGDSRQVQEEGSPSKQYPVPTGPMTDIAVGRKGEEKVPLGFGATGSGKLIYAKPFISMPKVTVGGYADVMYNILSRQNLDNPSRNSFGQQRLVPFLFADITDRVKFAAEIEIERGGPNTVQGDGSLQVEFAQLDYLVNEAFNLRAGILLMPVGKFNLLHDSPLNDLVDRPMVSRLIIPSTWYETGAGIYGTFYPTALSKIDYEVYAVNGVSHTAGNITDLGIRSARGSVSRDRDDNKAVVGRLAISPMLGIEVAGSAYHGQYKPSFGAIGSGWLSIYAVDWTLQRGPFELIGEAALSRISNNKSATNPIIGPSGMFGYYVQGNYHFMPEILRKLAPSHFGEGSTFTFTLRWEQIDTDTDNHTLALSNGNRRELDRLTVGLNYRPVEDFVFKFNWQYNTQNDNARGIVPVGDLGTSAGRMDGDGFLLQMATYF